MQANISAHEKTPESALFSGFNVVFRSTPSGTQAPDSRMKYPAYRRAGLPTTSALMESLVKEINIRVKGTEKFWNDGAGGEAILQLRAAALCDDDRLIHFLHNRPGHPFHPNAPTHNPCSALAV